MNIYWQCITVLLSFCFISSLFSLNKKQTNTITIGFGGDVMLGRMTNEMISKTSYAYPWGNVLPLLKKNDLNFINLETTLTTSTHKVPKVFNFKADPDKVQTLKMGTIHVVNLANNHILDFGESGLQETISTLNKAGIAHVGAGDTIEAARKSAIITKNNIKIGILGYTDNEPDWKATSTKPGINYIQIGDIDTIKEDIKKIRPNVDLLIISLHWGPNMKERPSKEFIDFAHQIIDTGADIIHGHSAHIFQGIQRYKNKLILFDTGDFVDDYAVDPKLRNDRSLLFNVTISKENDKTYIKKLDLVPLLIDNMQVNLATGAQKEAIEQRITMLTQELK